MVLVISEVVVVVIAVVAASPCVRAQPPNVYPVRAVVAVRARDSVDNAKESTETRVADCVAGIVAEIAFPSKTIVGLDAVVAKAGTPKANMLPIVRANERVTDIGLSFKVSACILTPC
jgi:hypothetical protein